MYLFALTIVNGIKILHGIHVDYEIVGIMIAASFLSFSISGIAISSTAVGIVVGIIANFINFLLYKTSFYKTSPLDSMTLLYQ